MYLIRPCLGYIRFQPPFSSPVELLCNRVAIIDQGCIIAIDTIKNLIARLGGGVIHIGVQQADEDLVAQFAALPAVEEALLLPKTISLATDGKESPEVVERLPAATGSIIKVVAKNSQQAIVNAIQLLNDCNIPLTLPSLSLIHVQCGEFEIDP